MTATDITSTEDTDGTATVIITTPTDKAARSTAAQATDAVSSQDQVRQPTKAGGGGGLCVSRPPQPLEVTEAQLCSADVQWAVKVRPYIWVLT